MRSRKHLTEQELEIIKTMVETGVNNKDICSLMEIDHTTIARHVKAHGWKRPRNQKDTQLVSIFGSVCKKYFIQASKEIAAVCAKYKR